MTEESDGYQFCLTRDTLRKLEWAGFKDAEIAHRCRVTRQAVSQARRRWNLPRIFTTPHTQVVLTLPDSLVRALDNAVAAAALKSLRSRSGYIRALLQAHFDS